ncbi:acetoacetate--CoA ligase [Fodinicurvata sp. EGI_FJ10296]|uniref:acetoacetate--CoA ligase n=1 Tax=Fodinicurvata sp. EGI_FJ10296 TaxID=3231908 RepID=UPI003452439D
MAREDTASTEVTPLWTPSEARRQESRLARFMARVQERHELSLPDYDALYQWSVDDSETFWSEVWDFFGIAGEKGARTIVDPGRMPGARFFPDARLNYAENLLQRRTNDTAIVFRGEDKVERCLTFRELHDLVAKTAKGLEALGVGKGDRVAGFMPNMPETVVAALATASLGAVWASASPDFGVQGVVDRFGQIEPKVLFTADGYYYGGKVHDAFDKLPAILEHLPTVLCTVVVPYVTPDADKASTVRGGVPFPAFVEPYRADEIPYVRVGFNDPLFIMFSSGTTGVPKCIVHGVGGTLLQHVKEHGLHSDIRPGDHIFFFTTCGWMMWNWLITGLASGATLLLYDGNPFYPSGAVLWEYAEAHGMTFFGTSAKYIDALAKGDVKPGATHDLGYLRTIASTGSPLAPESFDFVYEHIKSDVQLASISGGTDILSCFALGNPITPVYRGELQCRGLGMAVDVFDDDGKPVRGEKGELVCTRPFPSMPIGFWNDPDGRKYFDAYFDRFPNIWCHGDFVELTPRGGMIIYGRSDATLNPGGVRIGTAEIYRQVEAIDEVLESLVIGQDWQNDVRVILFVRLRDGLSLSDDLIDRIKRRIRAEASPRHVPAKIIQVSDIPRTKNGKITELAVRHVVHGRPVRNIEALANPEALELYRDLPELEA